MMRVTGWRDKFTYIFDGEGVVTPGVSEDDHRVGVHLTKRADMISAILTGSDPALPMPRKNRDTSHKCRHPGMHC
jgi:hypothetical protein